VFKNLKDQLLRALSQTGVGTVLVQEEIDRVVTQLVEYNNPLRQNFPRKGRGGSAWKLNQRTPGTTAAQFVADTDSFDESTGTYEQVSFAFETLGTQGKVTRKAQAIGQTYADILADEIEAKAEDFKDYEDWALFWADADNDNQWDGLNALCSSSNIVTTTTSSNGASVTLALMDEFLDSIRGNPSMILCSKKGRRRLSALLQSQQQFVNTIEIAGGFRVMTYDGIPILHSSNMPDILAFDGSDITSTTSGSLTAFFAVDTDKTFVGELTPLKTMPLAKTSSQFDLFDIYEDTTMVCRDPRSIAKLVGVL